MLILLQTSIESIEPLTILLTFRRRLWNFEHSYFPSNLQNICTFYLDTEKGFIHDREISADNAQRSSPKVTVVFPRWTRWEIALIFGFRDYRVQSCIPLKSVVRSLLVCGQNVWRNMTSFGADWVKFVNYSLDRTRPNLSELVYLVTLPSK